MTRAWRRGRAHLVAACLVGAGALVHAAGVLLDPPLPPAVADRLQALVREGYDHPEESLQRLRQLPTDGNLQPWLRYTEARLRVLQGDEAGARELYADPKQADTPTALHIRALLARRDQQTDRQTSLVAQALEALAGPCGGPEAAGRVAQGLCPLQLWVELTVLDVRRKGAQGSLVPALDALQRVQALAKAAGKADAQALLLLEAADVHRDRDDEARADAAVEEALALSGLSPQWRVRALNMQAVLAAGRGQRARQGELLTEALQIAERHRADRLAAVMRSNLADFYVNQHRPHQARVLAEQALPVLLRFREASTESHVRHNLAVALIDEREFDAARAQLARLDAMPPAVLKDDEAERLRELSQAWARAGQYKEALALYHAERKVAEANQAQARELALAEVRQRLGSAAQEARVTLLRNEQAVQEQTLRNQGALRNVGLAALVLLALCLALGAVFLVRTRVAYRQLRRNQALLQVLSERDPLTGLANRRQFHAVMDARVGAALEGSLILIDIDHFKRINDEHGHAAGDAVIKAYADRLSRAVRDGDMVVRWGGEEFLVYAPTLRGLHARQWVERLMPVLSSTPVPLPQGGELDVTCSMGFLTLPMPPLSVGLAWERALNWADMALYAAKNRGRRRAIGIAGLHVNDEVSMAQVEADFEGAASAARLSLVQVLARPAGT